MNARIGWTCPNCNTVWNPDVQKCTCSMVPVFPSYPLVPPSIPPSYPSYPSIPSQPYIPSGPPYMPGWPFEQPVTWTTCGISSQDITAGYNNNNCYTRAESMPIFSTPWDPKDK